MLPTDNFAVTVFFLYREINWDRKSDIISDA